MGTRKVFVFHCLVCKEDFETFSGSHRTPCPSCRTLSSVKSSYNEEIKEFCKCNPPHMISQFVCAKCGLPKEQ